METRSSLRHWLTLSTQWLHLFPTKSSRSRLWSLGQCKDSDQRSSGRAHHATRTFAIASNWRSPGCEQCGGFGTEPVVSPATAYIHTMCSLFHIWAPQRLCDALYSGWPKLVATFWKIQTELLKIWWVLTLEIHSNQRTAENNALFTMFEEKHFFLRSCMNANKLQITLCRQSQRHRYENIRAVPEQGQRSKSAPLWGGSGECWRERLRRTLSRRSGCSVGPTERRRRMWSRTPGNTRPALSHCASLNKQINTLHASNATVGNLFRTADRFQPGISLRTGPQLNSWCLAHVNLLQLVNHHGTDSLRDLGLLYSNKKLWSVGIMVVNGTRSVFLMSVVPVTLRPI